MANEAGPEALPGDQALADAIRVAAHELLEPIVMAEEFMTHVHDSLDPVAHADSRTDLAVAHRVLARARIVVEAILSEAVDAESELVRRAVDLPQLAADCVRALDHEITAREATVRVGPLPTVNGDEALLGAVLKNLLLNALKYGPARGGSVELTVEERGDAWRIAVASTGPAISDAARGTIFLPYRRGAEHTGAGGAGLGLAVCRRIVERHGGRIDVERSRAGANVFFFTLPA